MAGKFILLLSALAVATSAMPSQVHSEADPAVNEVETAEGAIEEMLEYMSQEELVAMLEQETEETKEAFSKAIRLRTERASYDCNTGPQASLPFCSFLRNHLTSSQFVTRFGSQSGDGFGSGSGGYGSGSGDRAGFGGGSGSGSGDRAGFGGGSGSGSGDRSGYGSGSGSGSGDRAGFGGGSGSGSGDRSGFGGSSGPGSGDRSGFGGGSGSGVSGSGYGGGSVSGRFGLSLEPSYSHDACLPPVTHVVREAVEYLPKTIYNTQHLILPSTRVLTMVETEGYPQPIYETVTTTLAQPDKTITATVLQQTERTLDVNSARQTDVLLRSTKLHIFTDTKDYFWTKTEFQPYYETVTQTQTNDLQTDVSHQETRYEDHTFFVTTTQPHVITSTSTSSTVVRTYVTETAHQYRYVAVTPVPVTVTETVTHCYAP